MSIFRFHPRHVGDKCAGVSRSNTVLTHGVKKVYFFSHIERYGNDLLRPPPFSIHAPYAGATSDERTLSKYPIYFNPHPHKGATSGDYLVSSRTAAVNRREIFAFWERFANALHRPPPDCHKKVQKSPKNWDMTPYDPQIQSLRRGEKIFFSLT